MPFVSLCSSIPNRGHFFHRNSIEMTVSSTKLASLVVGYRSTAENKNILLLSQQSFSLRSASASGGYRSQSALKFFPKFASSPIISPPLSRRDTAEMRTFSKINSIINAMKGAKYHNPYTEEDKEEENFRKLVKAKEKIARIHVYVQDVLGGPNATVWEVARSARNDANGTFFSQVKVVDDLLTSGPEADSEKLGRTQGFIVYSGLDEMAITMNLNFYFTTGEYAGSYLCIGGRNPVQDKTRELPIVGGSGVFRLARGYCFTKTLSFDPKTEYGILEYTFYVAYADTDDC